MQQPYAFAHAGIAVGNYTCLFQELKYGGFNLRMLIDFIN